MNRQDKDIPVRVGSVIAGRYRVDRVLGRGGMGVVVAATHLELLEPRAVKLMLSSTATEPELAQRFLREARFAARLKSDHVVKVHDMGRLDDGAPFLVMEHLEGYDLRELRRRMKTVPLAEALLYVLQVCEGLAEAHALGLVHRDIKPSNLFLTSAPDGSPRIKILDFGISKLAAPISPGDDDEEIRTITGAMLGTPHYMSPEQMLSLPDLDARADVWALGVLLYLLLTGRYPLQVTPVEVIAVVLHGAYAPVAPSAFRSELPPGIDAAILRCLERDRARRHASVAELARALAPFAPPSALPLVERIERLLEGGEKRAPVSVLPGSSPPTTTPLPFNRESHTIVAATRTHADASSTARFRRAGVLIVSTLVAVAGIGLAAGAVTSRHRLAEAERDAGSLAMVKPGGATLTQEPPSIEAQGTAAPAASAAPPADAAPPQVTGTAALVASAAAASSAEPAPPLRVGAGDGHLPNSAPPRAYTSPRQTAGVRTAPSSGPARLNRHSF